MTTEEVYNKIIEKKESGLYPELDELNSTSKVAVWRLLTWIFAFFSKTIRELFDSFKLYIELFFAKSQTGTSAWWDKEVKKWQSGDSLEFIDGVWKYAIVDEAKQIIKQSAIEVLNGVLIFKMAKDDGASGLTLLDPTEQAAFKSYCEKIKMTGTFLSVVSLLSDNLKLNYKMYFNAEYAESEVISEINSVAEEYLKNIVFNGKFQHTELTDEFQKIEAVKFPIFVSGFAKPDASVDYIEFTDNHTAASGYFSIIELNLDMIPNV